MKRLLLFVFVLTSLVCSAQRGANYQTIESYIGYKGLFDESYSFDNDPSYAHINIKIEATEIVIYSTDLTHLRVGNQVSNTSSYMSWQAWDDDNLECLVTVGFDNEAELPYLSVAYPKYILVYYLRRL